MKAPLIPKDEAQRLEELKKYSILDTEREPFFDELTKLAASLMGTEIAIVSLLDSERQWFKSSFGLDKAVSETPRDISFCGHAILGDDVFVVEDATKDERFFDNPLVEGSPNIKFYAGAPLTTPRGRKVGTLCVIDSEKRHLSEVQKLTLKTMAKHIVDHLELHLKSQEILRQNREFKTYASGINKYAIVAKTDGRGKITYINDLFLKISQYSREEVIGSDHRILNSGYHPKSFFKEMWETILSGQVWRGEVKNKAKDGSFYWVDTIITPHLDGNGKVDEMIAFRYDITERKIMEEKLLESEKRHRLIFDQSVDAVVTLDPPHWKISSANDSAMKLFGYPNNKIYELGPAELSPVLQSNGELSSVKAHEYYDNALKNGSEYFEWTYRKYDGTLIDCTVLLSRINSGEKTYLHATIRDITEQKKAENELLESRKELLKSHRLLGLALDAGHLGIWDWNLSTNEVFFDPRWSDMIGLKRDEVKMELSTWESRVHTEDLPHCYQDLLAYFDGKTEHFENIHRIKHENGQWLYILDRGKFSEWDENGKPIRFTRIQLDITKQKTLEGELIDAQTLAKVGSWTFNFTTETLISSPEFCNIFEVPHNLSPFELAKQALSRVHPEDLEMLQRQMEHARSQCEDFTTEYRLLLDNGTRIKHLQVITKVVKIGDDVVMNGTCRDRTLDVEKDAKFGTLLESMNEGLIVYDSAGKVVQYNPSALNIMGGRLLDASANETNALKFIKEDGSAFPDNDYPHVVALTTGKPLHNVIMGLRKDGEVTWIKVNAVPFDRIVGRRVLVTFTDITDLKKANEDIQFVLDALDIGVWKMDVRKMVQYWDKTQAELYDVSPDISELSHDEWKSFLTPKSLEKYLELVGGFKNNNLKEFNTSFEILTKKGENKFIGSRARVIRNDQNEPVMLYGINWDMSKEIELQKSLDQERAKALHNAKLASIGQLAAGVGHEINNPLAIISGQLSMAEQHLIKANHLDKEVNTRFEKIQSAVDRISHIVKGLRTFARSDDGQMQNFDLSLMLRETVEMLQELYTTDNVQIICDVQDNLFVFGNRGRLQQVFINLITNAKDATEGKSDRRIEVKTTSLQRDFIISVSDNGCGIKQENKEKIFDPFFTTKEVNKGTGIGLSLVNNIVKEHMGKIELETAFGLGSTFSVHLPIEKKQELHIHSDTTGTLKRKKDLFGLKVLVIDDEEDLREILQFKLSRYCEQVTVTEDPYFVLETLKKEKYDLVISDIKMPVMDGFQLLKHIRENKDIQQPKVILSTGGVEMSKEQEKTINKLADGFIQKPFKDEMILQVLNNHFKKSTTLAS